MATHIKTDRITGIVAGNDTGIIAHRAGKVNSFWKPTPEFVFLWM
jgi:hypothetical protein